MTKQLLITLLFLCTLLIAEHAVFLPFIVLCYHLANESVYSFPDRTNCNLDIHQNLWILKKCFLKCSGLFIALFIFVIYFALHATSANFTGSDTSFKDTYGGEGLTVARILWMAPQILVHIINLILFPIHLSIDQGALIHFANSYFSIYSLFCLLVSLGAIVIWIVSFWKDKNVFVLLSGFLISLVPFLQIIAPTYCMAAERYYYMPLYFLVLGIGYLLREPETGFHNSDGTVKKLPGLDEYMKRVKDVRKKHD